MAKKLPLRQCVGCREMKEKRQLVRVIKTPEDNILIDDTGRKNGRGAYVCKDKSCLEQAMKNKGLERSLKVSIPIEIYNKLTEELKALE